MKHKWKIGDYVYYSSGGTKKLYNIKDKKLGKIQDVTLSNLIYLDRGRGFRVCVEPCPKNNTLNSGCWFEDDEITLVTDSEAMTILLEF